MIHKIKMLYDNGNGLSIRAIAKETGLSRNTVSKYLKMDELAISHKLANPERCKQMDPYRTFITKQLQSYPGLTATKIARKLGQHFTEFNVSERTVRRYVRQLRQEVCEKQPRYYEPILDMVPGQQCQVDPGELRGVMINGVETTVYFVVFVLSYSRLMHVSACFKPIDTSEFIRMHDAALRYFDGCPQELVYDQTKLVVLKEQYRELELNQRLAEYATHAGYAIRACEGFDPESKGKVEAGVKYVKQSALYGEEFTSREALLTHLADWVDHTANQRLHGTTGCQPRAQFESAERSALKSYMTPLCVHSGGHRISRKADKTGLISWKANKYSVPMAYQRQQINVMEEEGELVLFDLLTNEEIARHSLSLGKGKIVKNNHHYRDLSLRVEALEQELREKMGLPDSDKLFALLKQTSPKIYKDQLVGLRQILARFGVPTEAQLQRLCERPRLTATQLESLLKVMQAQSELDTHPEATIRTGALNNYSKLGGDHAFH